MLKHYNINYTWNKPLKRQSMNIIACNKQYKASYPHWSMDLSGSDHQSGFHKKPIDVCYCSLF